MNVFGTTHAGFIYFFTMLCFIAILLIAPLLVKKISNKIFLIEIFVIMFLCVKLGCSAASDMIINNSSNNIGKAINDKFPGAEMLSDVSSSGSFKYKEEFYTYKVETNVLYIECYSDSNVNNVIISGKDY
ncbi:MAG TPA: hypothetical protein DD432_10070 [Eubacterium sp.]|nr:hypothetical protein [Eubacterium sp.]